MGGDEVLFEGVESVVIHGFVNCTDWAVYYDAGMHALFKVFAAGGPEKSEVVVVVPAAVFD